MHKPKSSSGSTNRKLYWPRDPGRDIGYIAERFLRLNSRQFQRRPQSLQMFRQPKQFAAKSPQLLGYGTAPSTKPDRVNGNDRLRSWNPLTAKICNRFRHGGGKAEFGGRKAE